MKGTLIVTSFIGFLSFAVAKTEISNCKKIKEERKLKQGRLVYQGEKLRDKKISGCSDCGQKLIHLSSYKPAIMKTPKTRISHKIIGPRTASYLLFRPPIARYAIC